MPDAVVLVTPAVPVVFSDCMVMLLPNASVPFLVGQGIARAVPALECGIVKNAIEINTPAIVAAIIIVLILDELPKFFFTIATKIADLYLSIEDTCYLTIF